MASKILICFISNCLLCSQYRRAAETQASSKRVSRKSEACSLLCRQVAEWSRTGIESYHAKANRLVPGRCLTLIKADVSKPFGWHLPLQRRPALGRTYLSGIQSIYRRE